MALVSPGIQVSINDQSQLVNSNVGSVPLVLLATAQDKTYNGAVATGTTKANAGKLLSFSSQRDLVTQMGTPNFQLSSIGTPVNGSEVNEYGLLTAYSALGLSNQLFAIRADIDLAQLTGTSVRPIGEPADGTYWLDLANTDFGIYSLDRTLSGGVGGFVKQSPLLITGSSQVENDNEYTNDVPRPLRSVGSIGDYALVFVNTNGTAVDSIRLFHKAGANSVSGSGSSAEPRGLNNTWVQVGSPDWQKSLPAVVGTITNPTISADSTLTITLADSSVHTISTLPSTGTALSLAQAINSGNIPGVVASATSANVLQLFVTSEAGSMTLTDGAHSPLAAAGVAVGTYYAPIYFCNNYAASPAGGWFTSDSTPRPTGSVWFKTSATGGGYNPVLYKYSATSGNFNPVSAPAYAQLSNAIYGLDPNGGGTNISANTTVTLYVPDDLTYNAIRFYTTTSSGAVTGTGGTPESSISGTINLKSTVPTTGTMSSTDITISGGDAESFVSDILAANIPYVTAAYNNGVISISHTLGGQIIMSDVSGTPLAEAGFDSSSNSVNVSYNIITDKAVIDNFDRTTDVISYKTTRPYSQPDSGTYWYYSNPTEVDIMINSGSGWVGYAMEDSDVRGYNLTNTDPNGVIVTPTTAPTSQSTGGALVRGDLWLDSGDLANYPALYRYNGSAWVAIDNTDHVSSNGIVFADARWDSAGTTDIISDPLATTKSLLSSDYIDLDAPNYQLYPRGTLLFNTRRSGYNVKKFVANYFNADSFPNVSLPSVKDAWVTASGLDVNGVVNAGTKAQRALVVSAMQSAVDSNLDVLSQVYRFNLIVAPNYPELIPNMITLNDNRGNTAFIIGDTPMTLKPNTTEITNYLNNTSGDGLPSDASANAYLALYYPAGRTNDLAGNTVVVPASHAVLRTYLYNDQVAYPWFAPAGVNRGAISNLSDIGYIDTATGLFVHNSISQGLRDALFTLDINPITQLPDSGLVVWGQLTRLGSSTARDRVNVVRLENYLRTIFSSIANGYLFEPNDAVTRKSIASQIQNALNNIMAHRGLYDFLVICDTSNNTSATIANNQLYVDVAIEPIRDVEFIYIPIAIYNPGSIAALNVQST